MKPSLYKGSLETIIIKLLEEEKMYGYQITQKIKTITQGEIIIKEGSLYPLLHKMEAEGLLSVSTERYENRLRKYYTLTKAGNEKRKLLLDEMHQYLEVMKSILIRNHEPKTI